MYDEDSNELTEEEVSDIIAVLIEEGALEILGYDSISDQITYKITDKCKELYPQFYAAHFESVSEIAMQLWMDDVIDIIFAQGQTIIGLTPEQMDNIKKTIDTYDEDKRLFLESILSYYTENGV